MPDFCTAERDGRILTVTINRPEVMNSLHPAANHEMGVVFDDFCADDSLWVAIVTGAGQGIGRAIAFRLANAGAHIALADLNLTAAEDVAKADELANAWLAKFKESGAGH